MGSEWRKVRIGDVAEVYDGPHATPTKTSSGPIFLGINTLNSGRLNLSDVEYLSEEDFERWTRRVTPKAGDIVFSYETRLGQAALIPEGLCCCLGRRMGLVRVDKTQLDPLFFLYQYISPTYQEFLRSRTIQGSTVDRFAIKDFPNFPIVLPPLPEQRAIAHILGSLDDKIELNRRMNETLEAIARALFQSWFVDFDPVRAKASGEPEKSICQRLGLTPELLALFPDSFEDSELGEIPAGWEIQNLDKIANFLNGLALQKYPSKPETNDYLPVIKIAQLRKGNTEGADRASLNVPNEYIIHDGDVLFSWSGSLEVVLWCGDRGALNQHLFKVSSNKYPRWFYLHWTKYHLPTFKEIAADKATTMGHIQRRHLTGAITLVPPDKLLSAMTLCCEPLISKLIVNNIESRSLVNLRDTLLPKLLSGQLNVNSLEVPYE